jgi:hypothetical protein
MKSFKSPCIQTFETMNRRSRVSLALAIGAVLAISACSAEYSRNQSPFEWKGLRAGMRLSALNRLSQPGSAWKCNQFIRSAVGLERTMGAESRDFSAGRVIAIVDTVGQRVLHLHYSVSATLPDTSRKTQFERELAALALKWDKVPGVIRHPANEDSAPAFAAWESKDSLWSARILYDRGAGGPARPNALEIEELAWSEHLIERINESLKKETSASRTPSSGATPNAACDALLRSLLT